MEDKEKCSGCGADMIPSQYAFIKKEGEAASRDNEKLTCSNPECPLAEKIIKDADYQR